MSIRALRPENPQERARWIEVWNAWPDREPHWHPAYLELFRQPGEELLGLLYEAEDFTVLMPVVLRRLDALPWAAGSQYVDASTPYGYGGPAYLQSPTPNPLPHLQSKVRDGAPFWSAFDTWAQQANLVSFVARLSLFPEQILPFDSEVQTVMQNVVRTLDLPEQEMWMEYEHKVRKNVNRAHKHELRIEVDIEGKRLDDFMQVYLATMHRTHASKTFMFDRADIEKLLKDMPEGCMFFHTLLEGKVISTELALVGTDHIYSFLGGTDETTFEYRPNDLLKHEIINWARANGKKAFVMGGGFGANDGIFRYKLSFAPHGATDFKIGKRILNKSAYDELCSLRAKHEQMRDPDWTPSPTFFPAYRAPAAPKPEPAPDLATAGAKE